MVWIVIASGWVRVMVLSCPPLWRIATRVEGREGEKERGREGQGEGGKGS